MAFGFPKNFKLPDDADGFVHPNDISRMPGAGRLHDIAVVFFNAPLSTGLRRTPEGKPMDGDVLISRDYYGKDVSDYGRLRESYQKLFNEVYIDHKRTIVVPCFSVARGGLDSKKAAEIAVEEAVEFIKIHTDFKIDFVPYVDDAESIEHYANKISSMYDTSSTQVKNIRLHPGDIVDVAVRTRGEETDHAVVCPIREGYNVFKSGPTTRAIIQAFDDRVVKPTLPGVAPLKEVRSIGKIRIQQGSILKSDADMIVCPARANSSFRNAVFNKANLPFVNLEWKLNRAIEVEPGHALLTKPGLFEHSNGTKGIIHTFGPKEVGKVLTTENRQELGDAYREALDIAEREKVGSIAFPPIDLPDFPIDDACVVFKDAVDKFFEDNPNSNLEVRMVLNTERDATQYQKILQTSKRDFENALLNSVSAVRDERVFQCESVVTVDKKEPLNCKKVMFFGAPTKKDLMDKSGFFSFASDISQELDSYYDRIFQEALKLREEMNFEGEKPLTIAIPTLCAGKDGIDQKKAAEAAWRAAVRFKRNASNSNWKLLDIRLVPVSKDGEGDYKAYQDVFRRSFAGLDVFPGPLEHQNVDVIVVPAGVSYESTGPICDTVFNSVKTGNKSEHTPVRSFKGTDPEAVVVSAAEMAAAASKRQREQESIQEEGL